MFWLKNKILFLCYVLLTKVLEDTDYVFAAMIGPLTLFILIDFHWHVDRINMELSI